MSEIIHFLVGIFLAFIVAIPVGPVNLAVVQNSIKYGMLSGFKVALGSALVEFFYCFLAIWGVKTLFTNPNVLFVLQVASIPLLLVMGIYNLTRKKDNEERESQIKKEPKGDIILGASLTLVNPMLLPFWMGVGAYLKSLHIFGENFQFLHNVSTSWAFIFGVASGSFLLLVLVALISSKKKSMNIHTKIIIYKILGSLFLVLAAFQSIGVFKKFFQ
jgi:threonine/homoserine/homoserine lactone efflux protein